MRSTGNGVADGTQVTTAVLTTAGGGDLTGWAAIASGGTTADHVTAGDGFDVKGGTGDIRRRDYTATTAGKRIAEQWFYTPTCHATTNNERIQNDRSASVNATGTAHTVAGLLSLEQGTSEIIASRSPVLTLGHTYQIDRVASLNPGTPSSSNGRIFFRVKNLTNPAWNTTGDWFYDTGWAVNAGTADFKIVRWGKQAAGVFLTLNRIENEGAEIGSAVLLGDTSRAQAEAYFLTSPYTSGTDYTADPVDAVGISDTAEAILGYSLTIADPVGITDTGNDQVIGYGITPQDTVGLADSAAQAVTRVSAPTDPVALADAVSTALGRGSSTADSVAVVDTATAALGRDVSIPDAVGVTDAAAAALGRSTSPADVAALTDAVAIIRGYAITISDTLGGTDVATPSASGAGAAVLGDAIGISDSITITRASTAPVTEPIGITDAITVALSRVVTVADFLALTDSAGASATGAPSAEVADGAAIVDAITIVRAFSRTLADAVPAADAVVVGTPPPTEPDVPLPWIGPLIGSRQVGGLIGSREIGSLRIGAP